MNQWFYYDAPKSAIQILSPLEKSYWPPEVWSAYAFARSASVALIVSFNDPVTPVTDLADLLNGVICFYVRLPIGTYLVISDRPLSGLVSYRLN